MSLDQLFSVNMETKTIEEQKITIDNFNYLFKNGKYKNGVFIISFMSSSYVSSYKK
jgi:hypothetical protein